jgi:hypothetical protein
MFVDGDGCYLFGDNIFAFSEETPEWGMSGGEDAGGAEETRRFPFVQTVATSSY